MSDGSEHLSPSEEDLAGEQKAESKVESKSKRWGKRTALAGLVATAASAVLAGRRLMRSSAQQEPQTEITLDAKVKAKSEDDLEPSSNDNTQHPTPTPETEKLKITHRKTERIEAFPGEVVRFIEMPTDFMRNGRIIRHLETVEQTFNDRKEAMKEVNTFMSEYFGQKFIDLYHKWIIKDNVYLKMQKTVELGGSDYPQKSYNLQIIEEVPDELKMREPSYEGHVMGDISISTISDGTNDEQSNAEFRLSKDGDLLPIIAYSEDREQRVYTDNKYKDMSSDSDLDESIEFIESNVLNPTQNIQPLLQDGLATKNEQVVIKGKNRIKTTMFVINPGFFIRVAKLIHQ